MALTPNSTATVSRGQQMIQWVQLVQGIFLFSTNLLLLSVILYHRSLREKKEYIIILGVAVSDFVSSFCLFRSVYNLYNMSHGIVYSYTKHECLLAFHVLTSTFTLPAQGLMLVIQSVDRLIAVTKPFDYFGLDTNYAWGMVSVPFIFSAVQGAVLICVSWGDQTPLGSFHCVPLRGLNPKGALFWNHTHTLYGVVAVVLYGFVALLYRNHLKKMITEASDANKRAMKEQEKMVYSIGISSLFTLFLFVVPRLLNVLVGVTKFKRSGLGVMLAMLGFVTYNCNAVFNLFIYVKRHKEVRIGLEKMFKREELPEDLQQITHKDKPKTRAKSEHNTTKF